MEWIILWSILAFTITGALIVRGLEKKKWNKGICPKCGGRWIYFDSCFCGDRGYHCSGCGDHLWVSYDVYK